MSKKKGIFIRVDEDLLDDLSRLSKLEKKTKSELIRQALEFLSRRKILKTNKMRGIIKNVSLSELEEISDQLKMVW